MKLASLKNVLKFLSGRELDEQQYRDLMKETVLMTLARGTKEDTYIHPCEIAKVRLKIKELTGEDVSEADIRLAAHAEIYEKVPFKTCLERVADQLHTPDRIAILQALADVLKSDASRIREAEEAYFYEVARALRVTPAQLVGLIA